MKTGIRVKYFSLLLFILICNGISGQTVPQGIHYQAVARDNFGKELTDRDIEVMFSVIFDNPVGTVIYREVHSNVKTSKYGVFSLVIGKGEPSGGTLSSFSDISWENANHYLKVEVKFSNDFLDMGTMPFLSVPYALYAKKSLEPGPQGPKGDIGPQGGKGDQGLKGDTGDPATDNQKLGFDGANLTISPNGNTVNLSTLNVVHNLMVVGNKLSIYGGNEVDLPNHIQDISLDLNNKVKLTLSASEIDLSPFKQNLSYNNSTGFLNISNGTGADLTPLKNDVIQDLIIDYPANKLKINKNAGATEVDLSKYLDNKDEQTLSYNPDNFQLSITNASPVTIGTIIAFRAGITTSLNLPNNSPVDLIFDQVSSPPDYYNDGGYLPGSGVFQAPNTGIYSFSVALNLPFGNSSVMIKLTGSPYETIIGPTASSGFFRASIVMKLNKNDIVNIAVVQNNGVPLNPYIISGSFSGFRVY